MIVYRITSKKWAGKLSASGKEGRWNKEGDFVLYTAGSRSLACLENLVHINDVEESFQYKVTVINIPDNVKIEHVRVERLPKDWGASKNFDLCQPFGKKWLDENRNLVLRVPSSIILSESNYLINPIHNDFKKITVAEIEPFSFDIRLFKK